MNESVEEVLRMFKAASVALRGLPEAEQKQIRALISDYADRHEADKAIEKGFEEWLEGGRL